MICTKEYRMKFDEKARKIVSEMTFSEKVHMMAGHCKMTDSMGGGSYNAVAYPFGGCERLGVGELRFCDGPRGVVSGNSTCFPVAMARGATFDRDLEHRVGHAIGKEVLANSGNYFAGVCMNVPYNPGAGRSQESFSEDAYHMGEMAVAVMTGVQDENVPACLKHFAFNSMERSRFKVDVKMNKRTEREVYLPHFKKAVDAGAASVMNSYNLYEGKHCGHNPRLLHGILKDEWGFDGFVISDFMMGVRSAKEGIPGGCDVEMHVRIKYTEDKIKKCMDKGIITDEMLNDSCIRIVRTSLAFEEARKKSGKIYDKSVIACDEHVALAKEAADKSITLIQNKDNFLPLKKDKKIVFVGDLTDTENIGDHGSSMVRPPFVETILDGMKQKYGDILYSYIPTNKIAEKRNEIRRADAVIITCGMNHGDEGEFIFVIGGDRKSLELHKKDIKMINEVSSLNKNCGVILMGGNAIMTHSWKDKVKFILFAYYPGMKGGSSITDILFGKVNPSGKLPFSIAQDKSQYPYVDWNTKKQKYDYYHGYEKIDRENRGYDFPFGFGLSYTTFELSNAKLAENDSEKAIFEVEVQNTGNRSGAEVVQVYVSYPNSPVDRPTRNLKGFERVELEAGESKTVRIEVNKYELAWYDEKTESFIQDDSYLAFIGTSEQDISKDGIEF